MNVKILNWTPLWIASKAIRKCWSSEDKSDTYNTDDNIGTKDRELIERVGNKNKHSSTLEHLNYSFDIDGISRACLQELARHRHASMSVKSTRYTLKELRDEEPFIVPISDFGNEYAIERAKTYLVLPPHANRYDKVWQGQVKTLELLREELTYSKDSNDVLKYMLPESYKTSLMWTINLRSLQNFLTLRLNKSALWEIQDLSCKIVQALPKEHLYLVKDIVEKAVNENERITELIKIFD